MYCDDTHAPSYFHMYNCTGKIKVKTEHVWWPLHGCMRMVYGIDYLMAGSEHVNLSESLDKVQQ